MKGLSQFKSFDFAGFSVGKVYQVVGISDWIDRDTGNHIGKRVTVVITQDNTAYVFKSGQMFTNIYEKLVFKVASDANNFAVGDSVVPIDAVARCYGDYNNLLSITCKGIRVVPPQTEVPKAKE